MAEVYPTPGPYRVTNGHSWGCYEVVAEGNYTVAEVWSGVSFPTDAQARANAELFAAMPRLTEALRAVSEVRGSITATGDPQAVGAFERALDGALSVLASLNPVPKAPYAPPPVKKVGHSQRRRH